MCKPLSRIVTLGQLVYGQHPYLWHQLGILTSEQGVQQGDPLGPLLYALVLQKVEISISKDSCCADLLLHRWYLDDGAIAVSVVAVRHVFHILEELGPQLGSTSTIQNVNCLARMQTLLCFSITDEDIN